MALFGRRNRSKLILCILAAFLVGYLIFHRNNAKEVGVASRRRVPTVGYSEDNELLKRPVYEKPPLDMSALGEMGRAVKLNLNGDEKRKEEESIAKHQINTYVSDKISLHRRLSERWNPL